MLEQDRGQSHGFVAQLAADDGFARGAVIPFAEKKIERAQDCRESRGEIGWYRDIEQAL